MVSMGNIQNELIMLLKRVNWHGRRDDQSSLFLFKLVLFPCVDEARAAFRCRGTRGSCSCFTWMQSLTCVICVFNVSLWVCESPVRMNSVQVLGFGTVVVLSNPVSPCPEWTGVDWPTRWFNVCTDVLCFSSSCVSPAVVTGSCGFKGHSTVFSWRTNRLSHSFYFFHFVVFFAENCIKDLNTSVWRVEFKCFK